jgi:hypothetical protein
VFRSEGIRVIRTPVGRLEPTHTRNGG